MIEFGKSSGFASKASEELLITRKFRRKNFQSHIAVEAFVVGSIDDTHAASADLFQDGVVRNCAANHSGRNTGVVFGPDS